jgi:hypothetical protein
MGLANPVEKIAEYPRETKALLGYDVSEPFLGWLDLRSPMEILFKEKGVVNHG